MLTLVDRAIGFAARAHEGQWRKTGRVPYIAHPFGVAMILQQMGCDEEVVAAGMLHDVVEDTTVTLDEIRQTFGDTVADIVEGCTEPTKRGIKWERRKQHMIDTLCEAPLTVKLVAAADKYHNVSHAIFTEKQVGSSMWKRFGRGKEEQAWYYRSVTRSISANVPNPERYPIFAKLAASVEELFDGIESKPPQ